MIAEWSDRTGDVSFRTRSLVRQEGRRLAFMNAGGLLDDEHRIHRPLSTESAVPRPHVSEFLAAILVLPLSSLCLAQSASGTKHGAEDGAEIPPKTDTTAGDPPGIEITVKPFATPESVGHPISLAVDWKNRIYAAETERYTVGVKQSRGDEEMEDLELQSRGVEDFMEILRAQIAKGKFRRDEDPTNADPEYCLHQGLSDVIARYVDKDGDGVADERTVFADGFDSWYSGPGADVFELDGDVWYTNIPDLWLLNDRDGDGKASKEERKVVAHGFGTVYSFLGHDLHGLVLGPDGRVYWSIGDRSYNVTTAEGRNYEGKMGAVFRANRDGSEVELFARGLRNPQDLAFNARGDLMTGDNNCDKGDSARVLHIVEGADFGWRLPPQRADSGGPWMREWIWWTLDSAAEKLKLADPKAVLRDPTRPAWTLPPLFFPLGQGPSGACYYPGYGLPERYVDHFFLSHCGGGGGFVQSFQFVPEGATNRIADFHVFLEPDRVVGPSDILFGYDGRLYCTNWGSGWDLNKDSSIEVAYHAPSLQDPRVAATKELFATGFRERAIPELVTLLAHFDQRARLAAQLALVDRGDAGRDALRAVIADERAPSLSRMHAIHGFAQSFRERKQPLDDASAKVLIAALAFSDAQLREVAAIELGDRRVNAAREALRGHLLDASPRVRLHSAIALGKLADRESIPALAALLRDNADRDAYLRHGAMMGLSGCASVEDLAKFTVDPDRSVRLGAVLALRRLRSAEVARFLADADFQVASEAARAIYDERLEPAYPILAAELDVDPPRFAFTRDNSEAILRRAIALNLRLGGEENAKRLIRFAGVAGYPVDKRLFALECLEKFGSPAPKDPVWYDWWPCPTRDVGIAMRAFQEAQRSGELERIQAQSEALGERVRRLANELLPPRPTAEHLATIAQESENENLRLDSFRIVVRRGEQEAAQAVESALRTQSPRLRAAARAKLLELDPDAALPEIASAVRFGALIEKQSAVDLLPRYFRPTPRYVRVDLPGTGKILSIAELEVFAGSENIAKGGHVTQSSTDWEGPAELAVNGDTSGDHSAKPSVSHTSIENDPWFELDLGSARPVDAIAIWNRTDNGNHRRLGGAIVKLLDANRRVLMSRTIDPAPEVSLRIDLGRGAELETRAERVLRGLVEQLVENRLEPSLRLEVFEAAQAVASPRLDAMIADWRSTALAGEPLGDSVVALEGGDRRRGEDLFTYHPLAECLRCHAMENDSGEALGGTVGPNLTGVGARRDRRYLLRSMIDPQANVVAGFGVVSAMIPMKDRIDLRQLRDLVEFLKTSTKPSVKAAAATPTIATAGPAEHGVDRVGAGMIAVPVLFFLLAVLVGLGVLKTGDGRV